MIRAFAFLSILFATAAFAQDADVSEPPMTVKRMEEIVQALDPDAQFGINAMQLTVEDVPVAIVYDAFADRMRAMVPIRAASAMSPEDMMRVMQANFDTALDARYAVAQGRLWALFLHPIEALERDQLISGIGQTVNLARSYGTAFSSGAGQYGAGDSAELHRQLIERLLDKGQDI